SSQVKAFKSAIVPSGIKSIDVVAAVAAILGTPFMFPDNQPLSPDNDPPEPPTVGPS
ncbi:hypothetical protein LTR04_002447, partial [Oleoguttula sp. CCFEE 6159]